MSKDFPDRETIRELAKTKPATAHALEKMRLRRERQEPYIPRARK